MILTVFSDLHIHNYQAYSHNGNRLDNTLDVLVKVFEFSRKNNCKHILFCGDLYDRQKAIPTSVVNRTIAVFNDLFETSDIQLIAITGNHDLATRGGVDVEYVSALEHLAEIFDNFHLIDFSSYEITCTDGCTVHMQDTTVHIQGIPYVHSREDFDKALDAACDSVMGDVAILMTHQTPDQFMNGEFDCEDHRFSVFDFVFNGHVHKSFYAGNVLTVGSPLHRDFGDEGDEKGFWLIDTEATGDDRCVFVSTRGVYPEFKTGEPNNDFDYFRPHAPTWERESMDFDFSNNLQPLDLIRNYLKQENITNPLILKTGEKCVSK